MKLSESSEKPEGSKRNTRPPFQEKRTSVSSGSRLASEAHNLKIQLFLRQFDDVIEKEDLNAAIRILEEFQADPLLKESEKQAIAAAKNRVLEAMSRKEHAVNSEDKKKPLADGRIGKSESGGRKEQSTGAEIGAKKAELNAPEKTRKGLKALRKRVADLYAEDPEKCFAFLDSLEWDLIEDPVISTYQQKAIEAWRERSSEIPSERAHNQPDSVSQAKDIVCPVCSMPNPLDSACCSQCRTRLQQAPKSAAERPEGESAAPSHEFAVGKRQRPRGQKPEVEDHPFLQRRTGQGRAKYYAAAVVGCLCLIAACWWAVGRYANRVPQKAEVRQNAPEAKAIGSGVVEETGRLLNESGGVENLVPGSEVMIMAIPAPDLDAMVKVTFRNSQSKTLNGTVKLGDLKYVFIDNDPDFTLKHLELRYPDLNSDPEKLKNYVQSTHDAIAQLASAKPSNELLLKQARGYLQLAQTVDKDSPAGRTNYERAKDYLNKLPDSFEDVAALRKQCDMQLNPIPAVPEASCAETLGKMEFRYNQAYKKYKNAEFEGARQITDQMLRFKPAGCVSASEINSYREKQGKFQSLREKLARYGSSE